MRDVVSESETSARSLRVVHYLNQFFAGHVGETRYGRRDV